MKKISFLLIGILCLFLNYNAANAYTAYFAVDHPQLSTLGGFDIDVVGTDITALPLEIYYQGVASPIGLNGSVPAQLAATFPWDITKTAANGIFGFDNSAGANPLIPGVVLSITDTTAFTFDNFVFAGGASDGSFEFPYLVSESIITDGTVYTFKAVPIPGSILLLGSGLIGLIGIARRKRS